MRFISLSLYENDIFSSFHDMQFFNFYCALFALILPSFALILLFCFLFSLFLSPLFTFFFPLSSFFLAFLPLFLFPFSYFSPKWHQRIFPPTRGWIFQYIDPCDGVHLPYVLGLILAFVPRFRLYPRGKFLMVFIVPILGLLPDIEALLDEKPPNVQDYLWSRFRNCGWGAPKFLLLGLGLHVTLFLMWALRHNIYMSRAEPYFLVLWERNIQCLIFEGTVASVV